MTAGTARSGAGQEPAGGGISGRSSRPPGIGEMTVTSSVPSRGYFCSQQRVGPAMTPVTL